MSIQKRLLLTILPVVVITVAAVVGFSVKIYTDSVEEQVIDNAQLLSKSYSLQIDSRLKQTYRTSLDLASAIVTAVNIETVLIDTRKRYSDYTNLFYTSLEGKVKDMAPYDFSLTNYDFSIYQEWENAIEKKETVISNPVIFGGERVFLLFTPVIIDYLAKGESQVIGVSVMVIPQESMFENFDSVVYGDTGSIFIINSDGYFLYSRDKDDIMNRKLSDIDSDNFKEIERVMVSQKGGYATFDIDGNKSLISFSALPTAKWSLGVIGNYKDFTRSIGNTVIVSFIAVILGLIIATIVIIYIVNGVAGPIAQLTKLAEGINKGDMSLRSTIKSRSEVGILSMAINGMLDRLTHYNEVLEIEVDERTKELQAANEELESTNEQMEAVNEELSATVEELDTKNRELEQVNSDMEAVNEELKVTVEELDSKNREVEAMNEELKTTNEALDLKNREAEAMNEELQTINEALDKSNREGEALNEELTTTVDHLNEANRDLEIARSSLWSEMELAQKLQTVLLPEEPKIDGFDISAFMKTNAKVGGDYYDVINVEGRDWFLIGDVSGHGVSAGLIMMMVQTSIHVALSQNPNSEPHKLLSTINRTIHANIHKLGGNKYMTLTVFACLDGSKFSYAGAHLPVIMYRKESNNIEILDTPGAWIGLVHDIEEMNENSEFSMEKGDVLLLYTDGISEAVDSKGSHFNQNSLAKEFSKLVDLDSKGICESLKSLSDSLTLDDDVTVMVIKKV